MTNYIPTDKLIAEIESRMEDCKLPDGKFPTITNAVRYEELLCLRYFINSLQQEQLEVDIEKEYTEFVMSDPVYSKLVNGIVGKSIAHHFYELGINSKR